MSYFVIISGESEEEKHHHKKEDEKAAKGKRVHSNFFTSTYLCWTFVRNDWAMRTGRSDELFQFA